MYSNIFKIIPFSVYIFSWSNFYFSELLPNFTCGIVGSFHSASFILCELISTEVFLSLVFHVYRPKNNLKDWVTEEATQLPQFVLSSDLKTYCLNNYTHFVHNVEEYRLVES